jgi:ABC-2 type transport system permease protein
LYSALWQFGRYPADIYRQPIRAILVYMLPVTFVSTMPAHFLTRQTSPALLLIGVVAGLGALVVARVVWNAGLARYTSATS